MKHSLAPQGHSDIPACGALPFEGTARSLLRSLQRSFSSCHRALWFRGSSKDDVPLEVNLQHALGLSRCAVGQGKMGKVNHTEDEARSACDCQLDLC